MGLLVGPCNTSQLFFLFSHVSSTNPSEILLLPHLGCEAGSVLILSHFLRLVSNQPRFSQPPAKVNVGILKLICHTGLLLWMPNGVKEKQKLDMQCHVFLYFFEQNLSKMWNAWIVTNGLAKSIKSLPVVSGRDTCGYTEDYVPLFSTNSIL